MRLLNTCLKALISLFIMMSSIPLLYSFRINRMRVPNVLTLRKFAAAVEPPATNPSQGIEELRKIRIGKVAKMKEIGVNPYAYNFHSTHKSLDLQRLYESLKNGESDDSVTVSVAGRVMAKRVFGKLAFFDIVDDKGSIQAYLEKGVLPVDEYNKIREFSDSGDIIGVEGSIKRTDKGELSVLVKSWTMLTKSLLPLPDKFHGLTDVNKRYRQRHLDMISNPTTLHVLKTRSFIISSIRKFLDAQDFIEVETPILENQPGGADAKPFETHHNALNMNLTLRIATELHLKRLVVGGLHRVYEIGRIFRNEGLSPRHNPEFTSIELNQTYADFHDMMNLTEQMVSKIASNLNQGSMKVQYGDQTIDLSPPWRRVPMSVLVAESTGFDISPFLDSNDFESCKQAALANGLPESLFESSTCVGDILNSLFETVESSLQQPTFVTDYPLSVSPLAKPHRTNPHLTERFELFITGKEIANAFTELTDPLDQRRRFEAQVAARMNQSNERKDEVDEDFLQVLQSVII